jgi:hypothetical protein
MNRIGEYTTNREQLEFWKYHEDSKSHPPVAAELSIGHHTSLQIGLVAIEPPLCRLWQGQRGVRPPKRVTESPNSRCDRSTRYDL